MSRVSVCVGLMAAFLASTTPLEAQSLSVREALSYSFATGLVADANGDRIAWVENHQGVRNVWTAQGPDWSGRQLTSYDRDDGQDLANLVVSPDGSYVFFVRGGAPNRQGEIPDPLFTPDQEGRAVWRVPVTGGDPELIVETGGFSMSPDGSLLAYSQGRDLMLVDAVPGAEPRRLARIRGGGGSLTWSPDGTQLAFVSGRGDHSFIGVVQADGSDLRYLAPDLTRDGNPAWSPDGSHIAFTREPNERVRHLFAPRREALPFSLWIAAADGSGAREVWKASPGRGSAFSGVSGRQLYWGHGDHLVFPWEGDGWKHLYSVPVSGGPAQVLTPGEFEVQFVTMSPDRRTMIYDSGQDDIDRKHVWRVNVDGGAPERLTLGEGVEWGGVATGAGTIAYNGSSATEPSRTFVLANGEPVQASPETPYPSEKLVQPEQVIFSATDGMAIHGQLFLPPDHRPGDRHPAVLFLHGGSRRQMLLGFHHRGYYHNAYAMNQVLASAGFVVLSVNFRSGIGYGMEFREAENYGATGASEYADVAGAGLYLQSRDDVDPNRIGLWGGSYGGYLTALGLARGSDLFKAGVDIHGVHDWNQVINGFVPSYEPEDYPEFSELAYASSPMAFLDGWRSPVLIIHGDDDRNVPFSESVDLAEELLRRDVEFETLVFPDEVHGFLLQKNWVAAFEASLDFFQRKLGGGRP